MSEDIGMIPDEESRRSWIIQGGSRLAPVMEIPQNTKKNSNVPINIEIVIQFKGLDDGAYGSIVLVRIQGNSSQVNKTEAITEAVVGTVADYLKLEEIDFDEHEFVENINKDQADFAGLISGLRLVASGTWLSVIGSSLQRRKKSTLVVETDSDVVLARLRSSEKKNNCTAKLSQRAQVAELFRRLKDSGDFDSVGTRYIPNWQNQKAETLAKGVQIKTSRTCEAFQQTSGWRVEFDIATCDTDHCGAGAALYEIDSDGIPQLKKCRRRSFKSDHRLAPCQALLIGLELAVEAGAHSVVALAPRTTATALQQLYNENIQLHTQIEQYAAGFRDGLRMGMITHNDTAQHHEQSIAQQLAIEALQDIASRSSADDGLCRLNLKIREALDDIATNYQNERTFREAGIRLLSSNNNQPTQLLPNYPHHTQKNITTIKQRQQQRQASFILLNQHHVPTGTGESTISECYSDCASVSSLQSCSNVSSTSSTYSPQTYHQQFSSTLLDSSSRPPFPSHLIHPKQLLDKILSSYSSFWWRQQLRQLHLDPSIATVAAQALGHWQCGSLLQILDLNRFVRSRITRQSVSSFHALALGHRQAFLDPVNSWRREANHFLGDNNDSLAAFIGVLMARFFTSNTAPQQTEDNGCLPLRDEDNDYDMPPSSPPTTTCSYYLHDDQQGPVLRVECLGARTVEPIVSEFGTAVYRTEWYYAVYEINYDDTNHIEKELFRFIVHCSDTMLNQAARFMIQITLDKDTAEGDEVRDLFVLFKALSLARANSDPELCSLDLVDNLYQSAARCSCDSGASCCLAHQDSRHQCAFPTNALGHRLPSLFPPDYLHDYEEATFAYCGTGWGRKNKNNRSNSF
uniref:Uncharacterized protein n=1 Tax=Aureoumbra lagunensis TaxID=44058 RepID=A0A7S3K0Z9_9STRA